uniref:Uncharacterized protein n=1 Tax=Lepeophtheirus salmonis TaxID=72036 RepID=A0A0K2URU0_LEPSM
MTILPFDISSKTCFIAMTHV